MNYINLNGKITSATDAHIPVDNGAFRYGYGLFETMLVQDGVIRLCHYHMERLFAGLKQLYFVVPPLFTREYLENEILQTVKKNKLEKLCRVRLQMFASGGGLFGMENKQPGFVIECFPLEESTLQLNENGLIAGIATGLAKGIDSLSNLKSCNALIYAIAARQAKEHKWNDALICNTDSKLIESTIANIFWIKNGTIYTPPLTDGCIAGVMRRYILEKITVEEKHLSVHELMDADEVFLTNAIKKIKWVREIGRVRYNNIQTQTVYNLLKAII